MKAALSELVLYQPGGAMDCLYGVEEILYRGRSKFQEIMVVRLKRFGKALVLDGLIQSTEADEYIYHESLVHPAMVLHPEPSRVLILGGGEGATLREALKHSTVKEAVMVDIDKDVVEVSRRLLQEWHRGAFDDPRARVVIMDGYEYVKKAAEKGEKFDVVIMDLTDPYGEEIAAQLYTREAFELIKSVMSPDGVIAVQAGSSTFFREAFVRVMEALGSVFKFVKEYGAWVPSFAYVNSFLLASDRFNPAELAAEEVNARLRSRRVETRFFNGERYRALLTLTGVELL